MVGIHTKYICTFNSEQVSLGCVWKRIFRAVNLRMYIPEVCHSFKLIDEIYIFIPAACVRPSEIKA